MVPVNHYNHPTPDLANPLASWLEDLGGYDTPTILTNTGTSILVMFCIVLGYKEMQVKQSGSDLVTSQRDWRAEKTDDFYNWIIVASELVLNFYCIDVYS